MSSRNNYLSNEERAIATELFLTLQRTAAELLAGNSDFGALEDEAKRALVEAKQSPEYVAIRRASDLSVPQSNCRSLIFLAATRVGSVRLIDNILVEMP
jgi:pantoate--beta-alanine ligase